MIICSAAANAARLLFVARLMLWACRAVVCEAGRWGSGRVLTGMRQKSAIQFGGVPRLSRLGVPEAMILSYDFFAHRKSIGSMVDECLFLEIPTSLTCLRDYSFPPSPPF